MPMSDPKPLPPAAYAVVSGQAMEATILTRGPWDPAHQHAGPPTAMVCRAVEAAAQALGLDHIGRLTANLLRPVPIGRLEVEVHTDYAGRNAAHFSARLLHQGKELGRFTALAQRLTTLSLPEPLDGHPLPQAPQPPATSTAERMPFGESVVGYADLV